MNELVKDCSHPIIEKRLKDLVEYIRDGGNKNKNIACHYLLHNKEIETIYDRDSFEYRLYLQSGPQNNKILAYGHIKYVIIEAKAKHIHKLWNDGKQLIEHYKKLLDIKITNNFGLLSDDEFEVEQEDKLNQNELGEDDYHLTISIPISVLNERYSNCNKLDYSNIKSFAFIMLTSCLRLCLYSGNILNMIRYITFSSLDDISSINIHSNIHFETHKAIECIHLNSETIWFYYPNNLNIDDILVVIESCSNSTLQNSLASHFYQELSIAFNSRMNIQGKVGKVHGIKISYPLLSSETLLEIDNTKNLYITFNLPLHWLKSSTDSKKLSIAILIASIQDITYKIVYQGKCSLRCGLRKHVLQLITQECRGY
ncbi:hypothetical protein cand_010980 [Cryptosporidium andersoni]|uniref:Uncharacterized protein n=1 Tax=Cryptosporidium andersoni TaxID=117008 RepID=A0A1J4MTJ7_9CRYT|nr:hypothetical protein cand_010980 [Cryptosporidium andersoni]